jgi:hypothetical protein
MPHHQILYQPLRQAAWAIDTVPVFRWHMMANFSVVFEIWHNSKENLLAILVSEKFEIKKHFVEVQYHGWLLRCLVAQLAQLLVQKYGQDSLQKIALGP